MSREFIVPGRDYDGRLPKDSQVSLLQKDPLGLLALVKLQEPVKRAPNGNIDPKSYAESQVWMIAMGVAVDTNGINPQTLPEELGEIYLLYQQMKENTLVKLKGDRVEDVTRLAQTMRGEVLQTSLEGALYHEGITAALEEIRDVLCL